SLHPVKVGAVRGNELSGGRSTTANLVWIGPEQIGGRRSLTAQSIEQRARFARVLEDVIHLESAILIVVFRRNELGLFRDTADVTEVKRFRNERGIEPDFRELLSQLASKTLSGA